MKTTSSRLYCFILLAWAVVFAISFRPFLGTIEQAADTSPWAGALASLCLLFIMCFWLNSLKDIAYTVCYHVWLKRRPQPLPPERVLASEPRVLMAYCTYNDFSATSLAASMKQDYSNFRVVILDDSSKPEFKAEVDAFAREYGVEVVRRADRIGFKAGNMNNYLMRVPADYSYFVILDSDER